MVRIYLSLMLLVCGMGATAQQDYYVFIQETSRQPFYVRMGEESHSSSAEGHISVLALQLHRQEEYIPLRDSIQQSCR